MNILYLLIAIVTTASCTSGVKDVFSPKSYQSGPGANQTHNIMPSITVELKLPKTANQGDFIIALLTVKNRSDKTLEVSSRLNLNEGDVRLFVSGPTGQKVTAHGIIMADTPMQKVRLEPEQSIQSGLFISLTDAGFLFEQPGRYRVQAEYDPGGAQEAVLSEEAVLQVVASPPSQDPGFRDLTENENIAKEIATGGAYGDEAARQKLRSLAEQFPDHKEGVIARLALVAGNQEATVDKIVPEIAPLFSEHKPVSLAHWLTAVVSPLSPAGEALKKAFGKILEDTSFNAAGSEEAERARKIVLDQPLEN